MTTAVRTLLCTALIAFTVSAGAPAPFANFLRIAVVAPASTSVRVIWRPYAGALSSRGEDQQAALRARRSITDPDSIRRWYDPGARDTIRTRVPAEFIVDMSAGPVVIVADDSVRVEAQLTPTRGPLVFAWGRLLLIESDGRSPSVTRKR